MELESLGQPDGNVQPGQQTTAEAGDHPGNHERLNSRSRWRDRVRRRGGAVVSYRQPPAPNPSASHSCHQNDHHHQGNQREEVVGALVGQVDWSRGSGEGNGVGIAGQEWSPPEKLLTQEGQRQSGDGEVKAPNPQRAQPDDHRDGACYGRARQQGQQEVEVGKGEGERRSANADPDIAPRHQRSGGQTADAGQRGLPQRDLAGPS